MKFLRRLLIVFVVLFVASWVVQWWLETEIEPGSILVVKLSGEYVEAAEPPLLGRLFDDGSNSFLTLLSNLAKAERDERLAAVVLRIRDVSMPWSMAQELRAALGELREAGRPTLAYLETAALGANVEYFLASAADRVVVSPASTSPVVGLSMEVLFFGGLWEKLGAGVEAIGSGEYKTAAEQLAAKKMSEPHREMANSLLDSIYGQFVAGIAESRKLPERAVREAIDRAPVTAAELVKLGLVDGSEDFPQAIARYGSGPQLSLADYAAVDPAEVGYDPVASFALVFGTGMVVVGEGRTTPTGGLVLASDTVSQALDDAIDDPSIEAIVFRIDSPGGSPLAAELVWRAAARAREKGKPLVASVSSMAASGGYYVLAGADAVVAPPASLVGSIGVFFVRPVIRDLYAKLGIGVETLTRGAHADLLLSSEPLDAAGRARMVEEIEAIYELFVARVAAGRELSPERVHELGRGRVWTGAQALERGLVDEVGGLREAVRRAKREAGIDPDADVVLVTYPAPRTLAQQVAELLRQARVQALPTPAWWRRQGPLVESLARGGPLLLPPVLPEIR